MDAEYVFQSSDMLLTEEEKALSKDRTKPWGRIHAVLCAEKAINTPFAVVNADDYYGRSAYASMGSYLSKLKNDDPTHAMVGFKLENTMSPSGAVTRAICISDEHDKLISMEENYRILYKEGQIVSEKESGDVVLGNYDSSILRDVTSSLLCSLLQDEAAESAEVYWVALYKRSLNALHE